MRKPNMTQDELFAKMRAAQEEHALDLADLAREWARLGLRDAEVPDCLLGGYFDLPAAFIGMMLGHHNQSGIDLDDDSLELGVKMGIFMTIKEMTKLPVRASGEQEE